MAARILGIGLGSFILILLWSGCIFTLITTRKSRSNNVSRIGSLCLTGTTIITLILCSLPRDPVSKRGKDSPITGDHVSGDFGDNILGHHHHQHEHDGNHDANIYRFARLGQLPTDWMHVWRHIILILNCCSLLAALIAIYVKFVIKSNSRTSMANTKILKLE